MEVVHNSFMPGDTRLIDHIVYELKAQGIFDEFRKECISDVDTKPAYLNLRQRVEGSVSGFLKTQNWKPDMNKNQVREMLRKNISESGFLETGVEHIVNQVVNPKINTVFLPQVETVVYKYLGIEKPVKPIPKANVVPQVNIPYTPKLETAAPAKESFPKDLECNSPKSEAIKEEPATGKEADSPAFDLVEDSGGVQEENSVDSRMSGLSGVASQESNQSISESTKMEMSEDSSKATFDSMSKEVETSKDKEKVKEEEKAKDKEKVTEEEKSKDKEKAKDEERSKDKEKLKDKEKAKDKERDKKSKEKERSKDKEKGDKEKHHAKDKEKSHKDNKEKSHKDEKHKKSSKDKERSKEKDHSKDKDKRERSKSESGSSKNENKDKEKVEKKHDKSSRDESKSSKERSGSKSVEDKSKKEHKERKDEGKHKNHDDAKKSSSKGSSHKHDKNHSKSDGEHRHGNTKSSSKHDKDRSKDKKKDSKDDHYSSKNKRSGRRSTDRDSSDGQSGTQSSTSSLTCLNVTTATSLPPKQASTTDIGSGSGDSGNSDAVAAGVTEEVVVPKVKLIKPKFAWNMAEARKLMKIRKKLSEIERNMSAMSEIAVSQPEPMEEEEEAERPEPEVSSVASVEEEPKTPEASYVKPPDGGPALTTATVSKEAWDALEMKLFEQNQIDYNSYCDEYGTPEKLRRKVGSDEVNDPRQEPVGASTIEQSGVETVEATEQLEEAIEMLEVTPEATESNEVIEVLEITEDFCVEATEKSEEPAVITDLPKVSDIEGEEQQSVEIREPTELEIIETAIEFVEQASEATIIDVLQMAQSEDNCLYLSSEVLPETRRYMIFTKQKIRKLERDIRIRSSCLSSMVAAAQKSPSPDENSNAGVMVAPKRGRKRKQPVAHLNNNAIKNETRTKPNPPASKTKKVKNDSTDTSHCDRFSLPLSPADSDKSFTSITPDKKSNHVASTNGPKTKRSSVGSQRYSSDDLYKPRLSFTSRRRGERVLKTS